MVLKAVVDSIEGLPDGLAEHYVERDGKYHLAVSGMVHSSEVEGLKATVSALRTDKAGLSEKLGRWAALGNDPASVQSALDEIPALKKAAEVGGGGDVIAKAKELAAEQVEVFRKQAERDRAALEEKVGALEGQVGEYATRETKRKVGDAIRAAATEAKVLPNAVDDLLLYDGMFDVTDDGKIVTRDGVGVAPGLEPSVWLTEHLSSRPYLLPASKGGGAKGSGGDGGGVGNPWSAKGWNPTEQSRIAIEDRARAEQLASAAGSAIGAFDPPKASG